MNQEFLKTEASSMANHAHNQLQRVYRRLILASIATAMFLVARPAFSQSAEALELSPASPVAAAISVPRLIKFSGIAVDGRGYPITVPVEATFALYAQQNAETGAAIWREKQNISPNEKGAYAIYLGATRGLPAEVFTSVAAQYLGVTIEGEPEQSRTLLVSVPYALESGDAQTLGGLPASAFALAGSKVAQGSQLVIVAPDAAQPAASGATTVTTTGGASNVLPKFSGASTVVPSQLFDNGSSVGIGLNTPTSGVKLDVNGSIQARGKVLLPATGTATTSTSYKSNPLQFISSTWNSSTKKVDAPYFTFQSEPSGNNTAASSANLNLLFSNNGAASAETGLYFQPNGTIHFAPAQTFPYHGTVTSIGFSAPANDFTVTGSPVTGVGAFNLIWNTPPTSADVGSAIIKRDSNGGFVAGIINADGLVAGGTIAANSLTVYGPSYMGATNLAGPIGIGTNSPAAQLNLNQNNTASADYLLLGNTSSKGLQLRDNGSGVDIESFGVPLNVNYLTKQPTYLNPNGGSVVINDNRIAVSDPNYVNYSALTVGTVAYPNGVTASSATFEGDVQVDGGLFVAGTKNFRIDHPLDPENKYLLHAAIESSEVLNQYSGNITTDELGLATVQLPNWFDAENTDFRYQLTVIDGRFAQAIVSKEIEKNQFTISTNATNVKVSWQVTARRNDPYMKAHPMVVEQDKPAHERGTYIRPELYGQPEEKRTGGPHRSVPATPQTKSIAAVKP
jgi:hypothetical protein